MQKIENDPVSRSILLANPPKGFEGFFDKDNKKPSEGSKFKMPDFGGKESGGGGGGGGGQNSGGKKYIKPIF